MTQSRPSEAPPAPLIAYLSMEIALDAMRHWQVSRGMYPGYPISSITNGVHAGTWTAAPLQAVFDHHVPGWREPTCGSTRRRSRRRPRAPAA